MKLRRRAPQGRQRVRPPSETKPAPRIGFAAYRARRSEVGSNKGRQPSRERLDNQSQTPAAKPKRQLKSPAWLQRAGLLFLLLAVLAAAINSLTLSAQSRVVSLAADSSPALLRDLSVYETAANQLLADSIWNRNKITVDTGKVSQSLLDQFPELASASVTIPLLAHRPVIHVQSSQPAVILVASNGSFVLDTTGKAILRTDSAGQLPNLPQINDQSGLRVQLNRQALPAAHIKFIQTITTQLAAKQFTAATMTLPAATNQLDVQLVGRPYTIKFNLQNDQAREQAGTFLATIAELKKQNITPAQYVDVRVEGRAYYQ